MPLLRKRRYAKKSRKPMVRRRRQYTGYRKGRGSSQVFSETYKCGVECGGVNSAGEIYIPSGQQGQGFKLVTQMNLFPQKGDYASLWSAYKIIKAKFVIVPKWGNENFNEASLTTGASLPLSENRRIAYAINDMNDDTTPLTELAVLQDNGCKIRSFSKPITISLRPKPVLSQVGGSVVGLPNVLTFQNRGQWIEFDNAGTTVPHIGVDGFISANNTLTAGFLSVADVYCTVSFVCKDPR